MRRPQPSKVDLPALRTTALHDRNYCQAEKFATRFPSASFLKPKPSRHPICEQISSWPLAIFRDAIPELAPTLLHISAFGALHLGQQIRLWSIPFAWCTLPERHCGYPMPIGRCGPANCQVVWCYEYRLWLILPSREKTGLLCFTLLGAQYSLSYAPTAPSKTAWCPACQRYQRKRELVTSSSGQCASYAPAEPAALVTLLTASCQPRCQVRAVAIPLWRQITGLMCTRYRSVSGSHLLSSCHRGCKAPNQSHAAL